MSAHSSDAALAQTGAVALQPRCQAQGVGRLLTNSSGKLGPPLDLLARFAAGQWGVVVRWQLLEAGVTVAAIDYALRTGRLRQVHRGVYMLGGAAVCIEARWVAAVLACGPGAVLSHRDAAALWGLLLPSRRKLVDVTTPKRSRGTQAGIDLHRTRTLPSSSLTVQRAIPVTTVSRTLIDLTEVSPDNHLRRAVDEADRLGWLNLRDLDARMAGHRPPRPPQAPTAAAKTPAHRLQPLRSGAPLPLPHRCSWSTAAPRQPQH